MKQKMNFLKTPKHHLKNFFQEELFVHLKNADIFKLFKQAEHAIWVFKMRGTFSKASRKALETIKKISWPMHRERIEEIVKKAVEKIEKQQNVKNEGCEVEKMQEKESVFSRFIEVIKTKTKNIFSIEMILVMMWIELLLNSVK